MALKYHLDENMPHAVASGLKQRGVDVTTSTDASLIGATDEEQLVYALSQNRVLAQGGPNNGRKALRSLDHPQRQ